MGPHWMQAILFCVTLAEDEHAVVSLSIPRHSAFPQKALWKANAGALFANLQVAYAGKLERLWPYRFRHGRCSCGTRIRAGRVKFDAHAASQTSNFALACAGIKGLNLCCQQRRCL